MPMATIRKTRERIENAEGYEDVLITLSTWNTLLPAEQPSVMSIRDADGRFFTPGFFTGVHGHRSITQVIGAAKLHSARTRRPGFSVSEADVTITLPAGSTLTQLMDSDDPLQQQVVNIKRLQVGAQAFCPSSAEKPTGRFLFQKPSVLIPALSSPPSSRIPDTGTSKSSTGNFRAQPSASVCRALPSHLWLRSVPNA